MQRVSNYEIVTQVIPFSIDAAETPEHYQPVANCIMFGFTPVR
ncbi:hypothetical protein [Adonisia turfae]|nr:hypothetical protein [Adonisia turfae]